MSEPLKLLGVIEGFYGRPWTPAQRGRLYGWMAAWGMNTYLYGPKDDLWHRARWREPYPPREQEVLASLVVDARAHGVRFIYSLAPGLDLDWHSLQDREALTRKVASLTALGVEDFALLFDDIPYQQDRAAQALEQVEATHHVMRFLEGQGIRGLLLFCPTEYCAERAVPSVTASPYLKTLGDRLDPGTEVCWTGPQIVSPEISAESLREVASVLKRRPLLWDNFYASDYTSRRLHLGPYSGRPLELRQEVSGILCNPNTPLEPNFPGLSSVADYASAESGWTAEASGQRALIAWLPEFISQNAASPAVTTEDLAFLTDLLFVPHRIGPRARQLLEAARRVAGEPGHQASRTTLLAGRRHFRRVLHALETGINRDLLYDLHPFLMDVNEELTRILAAARGGKTTFPYRGGLADGLLRLGWPD
ncbi:beta-N-acetylglucosaminidase domain-containing protein [Deinococcus altitudinis]|uniref:beta-N-acetylglucosaminidase domain-containing protein n=1 Tax=Deinococcus altitudinis TaxID=468914 RepID=UPI003891E543